MILHTYIYHTSYNVICIPQLKSSQNKGPPTCSQNLLAAKVLGQSDAGRCDGCPLKKRPNQMEEAFTINIATCRGKHTIH